MKKTISSSEYPALIGWLKNRRLELQWSMRDLAARLDQPHSFVQRIEMLERRLDIQEYVIYCKALSLDPVEGVLILISALEQSSAN